MEKKNNIDCMRENYFLAYAFYMVWLIFDP